MATISNPMKPCNYDSTKARFPYLCTPKIDGIRFIVGDDQLLTYSLLPVPNKHLQALHPLLYPGMEGELFFKNFQESQSIVMSYDAPITGLQVFPFDYVEPHCPIKEYRVRVHVMRAVSNAIRNKGFPIHIEPLVPTLITNPYDLHKYVDTQIAAGHEGAILRVPLGLYKNGRSTISDQYLMRIKPFEDAEGIVVAINQLFRNDNPAEADEKGHAKRGSSAAGKVPLDMMGSITIKTIFQGKWVNVDVGSGFTDAQRTHIWNNPDEYITKHLKYKFQMHGSKDRPRTPIFLGFRDERDTKEPSTH